MKKQMRRVEAGNSRDAWLKHIRKEVLHRCRSPRERIDPQGSSSVAEWSVMLALTQDRDRDITSSRTRDMMKCY